MNLLQNTNPTIRTSTADFRWELTVASGSSRQAKGGKCTSVNGSEEEESDRCPRPACRWENLQSTRRYKQSHRPTCVIFFMATLRFSWIFKNKQYEWEQSMGSFNAYLQEYLSVVCVIVHHILKPFSSPVINCHLYREVFSIYITLDTRMYPLLIHHCILLMFRKEYQLLFLNKVAWFEQSNSVFNFFLSKLYKYILEWRYSRALLCTIYTVIQTSNSHFMKRKVGLNCQHNLLVNNWLDNAWRSVENVNEYPKVYIYPLYLWLSSLLRGWCYNYLAQQKYAWP